MIDASPFAIHKIVLLDSSYDYPLQKFLEGNKIGVTRHPSENNELTLNFFFFEF